MTHFKHTSFVNVLNNILVHFLRKSMAKIFLGLLSFYAIAKKETIIAIISRKQWQNEHE